MYTVVPLGDPAGPRGGAGGTSMVFARCGGASLWGVRMTRRTIPAPKIADSENDGSPG